MLKCSYNDLVLVLVCSLKDECTWYQLERALDLRGLGGQVNSVEIFKRLISEDFLIEKMNNEAKLSEYLLTDKGEYRVRQLLDRYGTEIFLPKIQNPENFQF